MATKSHRILYQMGVVSLLAVVALAAILLLKFETAMAWAMGDFRPLVLNGIIFVLFLLGTLQLYKAIRHYQLQENQINEYMQRRQEGEWSAEILDSMPNSSLIANRYRTIRDLFNGGGPVDHGAISAIMMAEESLHQSFPRFVNNVLILTGVFGTVSSLIFALVGAGDVLQAASPDAGMGLLLLGMNTALTTTATAIVCYFFFTFFFHRLTDLQTWVFSQVERAALVHMVPEFTYEPEALNHQTKLLIEEVKLMVGETRQSLSGIQSALQQTDSADSEKALLAAMENQSQAQQLQYEKLRKVLIEGFRLDGR